MMELPIIKGRHFFPIFSLLIILAVIFHSCYYDSEEYLYPGVAECDTTNTTYTGFVSIVMASQCNGCHNAVSPSGNVITDNKNDLIAIVGNGKLVGAINHLSGFSPMPKGQNKLSDCDLSRIDIWISRGTP